jgi:hypothetical protein
LRDDDSGVDRSGTRHNLEERKMADVKKVMRTGVNAGKKVLATDAAQDVIGAVVDKLEETAVDRRTMWPNR